MRGWPNTPLVMALAPPLVKHHLGQWPPVRMSKAHTRSGVPDRNQRRRLDGLGDLQQRLDLAFVLRMQRGQYGTEPESVGSCAPVQLHMLGRSPMMMGEVTSA